MDPLTLATTVVSILVPYLAKASEGDATKAAEGAAEAAWERIRALYTAIKEKFASDPYAKQTLKRLEENPQSKSRLAAMEGVIEDKAKEDPRFASELEKLVAATRSSSETINQRIDVSGHARTGNITQIGKAAGNVDLSK